MRRNILKLSLCGPQRSLYLRGGFRVSYNFPSLAKRGQGRFSEICLSIMDSLVTGKGLKIRQRVNSLRKEGIWGQIFILDKDG